MKNKKGSSYIGFALICVMLGSILISVGHFLKHDLKSVDLVEVTSRVVDYVDAGDDKVKVMCKFGYDGNEYNYICYTLKKEEAMSKYKIGDEFTIKINKNSPGRVTIFDIRYVIVSLYTIGLIFLIIANIYLIGEIIRIVKKNKEDVEGNS